MDERVAIILDEALLVSDADIMLPSDVNSTA